MSFTKAVDLLRLAMMATSRQGVCLSDVEAEFGCVRRTAQRMILALQEAFPATDHAVGEDLRHYELKYGLSSEEFYRGYQAGILNDELQHCMRWAAIYKMFVKTKRQLENALMRLAVQSEDEHAELEEALP